MLKKLLFILSFALNLGLAQATALETAEIITDVSEAKIIFEKDAITANEELWLSLHIKLKAGWHIYANPSGEAGYPTEINVTSTKKISISDIYWQDAIQFDSDGFLSYGYKNAAHHFIKVIIKYNNGSGTIPLIIKAKWLACNKICIPEQGEWSIEVPIGENSSPINTELQTLRKLANVGQAKIINLNEPTKPKAKEKSIIIVLISAFIGGLILNLMPCVLPILALKSLSLVKIAQKSRLTSSLYGISYTCGIIAGFAGFAIIISLLQSGGAAIGWGFQLQSPIFVALMALLMLLIGLNLSGFFEVPSLNIQGTNSKNAYVQSFLTGLVAVAVATPCTAPFMAGALGYAITQPFWLQLSVFISLGLGLSAPYLLISLIPSLAKLLPKSGNWLLTFKQFLAFPMYGAAAWLTWVLTSQAGADALAILLFTAIILVLLIFLQSKITRKIFKIIVLIALIANIYQLNQNLKYLSNTSNLTDITKPYSTTILQESLNNKRAVFIYATADWCITCKINERLTLRSSKVIAHFKANNIVVLKADFSNHDTEIAKLLQQHGLAGVPAYIYYDEEGKVSVLNNLITKAEIFSLK
jgi:thiol:disulfide interchange protein